MAAAFRTFHQGGEDGRTWDRKGTLSAGLTVIFSGLGAAAGVWQTSAVSGKIKDGEGGRSERKWSPLTNKRALKNYI